MIHFQNSYNDMYDKMMQILNFNTLDYQQFGGVVILTYIKIYLNIIIYKNI